MPTDINNLNPNNIGDRRIKGSSDAAPSKSDSAAESTAAPKSSDDQVRLSDEAQTLKRLQDSIADLPAFDNDRVESIREAIAEGRYHVDPERLAERFVALESELNQ